MKQSQKNIQIVKVQVGDLRKKRKVKRKTKGKKRSEVFSGTGLAPVLGQAFIPPMFPTSRAGTQFEPPKQQVVEGSQLADVIITKLQEAQQKRFESAMKQGSSKPEEERMAERLRALSKPEEWSSSSSSRLEEPSGPMDRPQQPLVSAEAASSSSSLPFQDKKVPKYIKPKQNIYSPEEIQLRQQQGSLSRAFLRGLPFRDSEDKTTLRDIADMLNIGIPDRVSKDELVEIIHSYRPSQ